MHKIKKLTFENCGQWFWCKEICSLKADAHCNQIRFLVKKEINFTSVLFLTNTNVNSSVLN